MTAEELLALCEQGVDRARAAGADQAEVCADFAHEREVSFEKNDLNLVKEVEETTFGIRVVVDGRMGFATSNRGEALGDVAAQAVALARASEADPFAGLPEPQPFSPDEAESAVDPGMMDVTPAELAKLGMELLRETLARDSRVTVDSGSVSVNRGLRAIVSSTGVRNAFESTSADGGLFGMAIDGDEVGSFSYDGDAVRRYAELPDALRAGFGRFVDKVVGALGPQPGQSFRGPVFLPADVVMGFLLQPVLSMLGADRVRQGKSPLAQKLEQAVAVSGLSVWTAGAGFPGFALAPFDREGMPRQRRALIDQGVLKAFLYDSYEGRAASLASTGDAIGGAGSPPSVGLGAIEVSAGSADRAAMLNMERGIYLTRFSGTTNPISGDFSGVVKGGFLIVEGKRQPIAETTLAGNLYECLQNISAVSRERRRMYGRSLVPALVIDDISVTAGA